MTKAEFEIVIAAAALTVRLTCNCCEGTGKTTPICLPEMACPSCAPKYAAIRSITPSDCGISIAGDGWQLIESAPKDREVLLYCLARGVVRGHWNDDQYAGIPRPYWTHDRERTWGILDARRNQPTHWRELPAPPSIAPDKGSAQT